MSQLLRDWQQSQNEPQTEPRPRRCRRNPYRNKFQVDARATHVIGNIFSTLHCKLKGAPTTGRPESRCLEHYLEYIPKLYTQPHIDTNIPP
jgi:hypothetical protein